MQQKKTPTALAFVAALAGMAANNNPAYPIDVFHQSITDSRCRSCRYFMDCANHKYSKDCHRT